MTAILIVAGALGALMALSQILKPSHTPARQTSPLGPTATALASLPPATQSTQPQTITAPAPSVAEVDKQDSYNNTLAFSEYISREQRERPAFQHLPYRGEEVHIGIADVTSDGRLVLEVIPLGLNVNPRNAYARFLRRYHDPGRAYLAEYGRYRP